MPTRTPSEDQPAPPDEVKAKKVAKAAADAAADSPDPTSAIQNAQRAAAEEAERQGLTDDDVGRLSSQISANVISELASRGAFEPPPEPVQAPPPPTAPPAPTTPPPTAPPAPTNSVTAAETVPQPQPQPKRRTFAHRFMGIE